MVYLFIKKFVGGVVFVKEQRAKARFRNLASWQQDQCANNDFFLLYCSPCFSLTLTYKLNILYIMQQQSSSNASKAYWLSFAVSRYVNSKNLTSDFVFPKLLEFGVMDFLDKHYETEHLENIIYVIEDMDNILKRNGGSLE